MHQHLLYVRIFFANVCRYECTLFQLAHSLARLSRFTCACVTRSQMKKKTHAAFHSLVHLYEGSGKNCKHALRYFFKETRKTFTQKLNPFNVSMDVFSHTIKLLLPHRKRLFLSRIQFSCKSVRKVFHFTIQSMHVSLLHDRQFAFVYWHSFVLFQIYDSDAVLCLTSIFDSVKMKKFHHTLSIVIWITFWKKTAASPKTNRNVAFVSLHFSFHICISVLCSMFAASLRASAPKHQFKNWKKILFFNNAEQISNIQWENCL